MSVATNVTSPAAPSNGHAKEVLRAAQHELNQLLRQRAEIMKRIGTVRQALAYLAKMFGDDQLTPEMLRLRGRGTSRKQAGFTRACRVILMEAATPLEARQGLREMQHRFPKLVEHLKHPLASVTTVFNRLVGNFEVRSFPNGEGRRVWEWIAEPGGAEASLLSLDGDRLAPPTASIGKQ